MCRYLVEPFIQRQPEAETGQGDTSWADWEDPHPSVRRWRLWWDPAIPLWGGDLLQHDRMPQVRLTYLCFSSMVTAGSFFNMEQFLVNLYLFFLSWPHLPLGYSFWHVSVNSYCSFYHTHDFLLLFVKACVTPASSFFGCALSICTSEGFYLQINCHVGNICKALLMIFIMSLWNRWFNGILL